MSGSHGTEDGSSGLTDKDQIDYGFYREDCKLLGIKPGPERRNQRLPLTNWNGVPDITKPAEKVGNRNSLLQDMDIRVCNIPITMIIVRNLLRIFRRKYSAP